MVLRRGSNFILLHVNIQFLSITCWKNYSFSFEGVYTFKYSFLENPMDRGPSWATVHGVAKSRTWLSDFTHTHTFKYNFLLESIERINTWSANMNFCTCVWTSSVLWSGRHYVPWELRYLHFGNNNNLGQVRAQTFQVKNVLLDI